MFAPRYFTGITPKCDKCGEPQAAHIEVDTLYYCDEESAAWARDHSRKASANARESQGS